MISAISSIASGVTHPSLSWAMCSSGSSADFECGYRASSSCARLRSSSVNVMSAPRSPVHLAHHWVDAGDDRDGVGHQRAGDHRLHRLQVVEGRTTDVQTHRLPGPVRHEVAADLTSRRLDRDVRLPGRHAETLGEELEVVDQCFHRLVDALAWRRCDLAVLHAIVARWHALDALPHDLDRLDDLVEPDQVPVVAVAVLG